MTNEERERLFEPFFTTKEVGEGTGLGMSIVQGVVEEYEGNVEVRSRVGAGTTITVRLPVLTDAPATVPAAAVKEPLRLPDMTVLVVDDEPAVLRLAIRTLSRAGATTLAARNAAEAEAIAGDPDREIDVLVTDVVMPGVQGPELARRLRERRPGLAVVFMSGYTDDPTVRDGTRGGTIPFLSKPFMPLELVAVVRDLIGG